MDKCEVENLAIREGKVNQDSKDADCKNQNKELKVTKTLCKAEGNNFLWVLSVPVKPFNLSYSQSFDPL